jgi:tetratricopeptide (TPR) repeat protein
VRQTPGAVELLECCAFLAPDDIPRDLFPLDLDPAPDWLTRLRADPFWFDDAIGALRRFSLVKATPTGIGVHRLLQLVIRDQLPPEQAAERLGLVVRLLRASYPFNSWQHEAWPLAQRLLPHMLSTCQYALRQKVELGAVGWLLVRAANYLRVRARFTEALSLLEQAMSPPVELDQTERGVAEASLGLVLHSLGELAGARAAHERSLAVVEKAAGPDHPEVARTRSNLGRVLQDLGDLEGARAQYERALEILEAVVGPEHPDMVIRRNNLGSVLRALGDLEGARVQFERALEIGEAVLGPSHPHMAGLRNNFGRLLWELRDFEGARVQVERALEIHEAALGPNHPNVAVSRNNLGSILQDLGDLEGARAHYERALETLEAVVGPNHPDVAITRSNLGSLLQDLGDKE